MKQTFHRWLKRREWALVLVLLIIAGFFHGYNMFQFPFFENDEGTYLAQAWSLITEGKLAPYTYWYDHAPFGWMFTAVWVVLTGGLFSFGFALNSARVFMWLIHIVNAGLLYAVSKKITRSKLAGSVTVFLFSISPLAVYFQRRLLLDNLMIFWVLVTLTLIYYSHSKLRHYILSGITFAFAVLTKENAIFFLPIMAWLVTRHAHPDHRVIATIKWITLFGCVLSIYPLYALLNGELFPEGSIFSPPHPHVSLLGTLAMQASRGSGLPIWHPFSDLRVNLRFWLNEDRFLIVAGLLSFFYHAVAGLFSRKSRTVFWLTLPQILFLASGKLVINFYIIALIPFLSLSIGLVASHVFRLLSRLRASFGIMFAVTLFIALSNHYLPLVKGYLTLDETSAQKEAVDWIKATLDPHDHIAIDFYAYPDLSNARWDGDPVFTNADWFWKVELDPDITQKKLNGDFRSIDYIMMSAEAQRQIAHFDRKTSLLQRSLLSSRPVAYFSSDPKFPENFTYQKQTAPNGDWVVMFQQQRIDLHKSWETYKRKFINPAGYVQGPEQAGYVISEAQSYALLRAVWMNDRQTFDLVYSWTKQHMQLQKSSLFGWKWLQQNKRLIDEGNAPDADQDIALALLLASKQWNDVKYEEEATMIIKDIWKYNVYQDSSYTMVTAGNWAVNEQYVTLNPSYWSPHAYRLFAEVDQEHDWEDAVDSSYMLLDICSSNLLDKSYTSSLPPEWCRYQRDNRSLTFSLAPQPESTDYGYNAFRIPWKIYLDYQWNQDTRALKYLQSLDFLVWQHTQNTLVDVYAHDAVPQTKAQRYAYIMNLPVFMAVDETLSQKIVEEKFKPSYKETESDAFWYEGDEYYLQNWAWFATAIYQGDAGKLGW